MKKRSILALLMAIVASFTLLLTACGKKDSSTGGDKPDEEAYVNNADYIELGDYKSYLIYDLKTLFEAIGSINTEVDAAVTAAQTAGENAVKAATDITTAKAAYETAANNMLAALPLADGLYNYSGLTAAEKTEILGRLEAYSVRNGMLGISMYENGGHVIYNERIVLGTENYIVGYGFGTLAEGSIKSDLDGENNAAWKKYYHTYDSSNPGNLNWLNDQGSQVGDLYDYMGASYYTNFMNATKDGYDWVPELAVGNPEPVGGLDENGQATTWRFEIRQGLRYTTYSTKADRAAFNGREVAMEDFLTPFKFLLNQKNGLYRGGELANKTGAGSIVGAKDYYEKTKDAKEGVDENVDFSGVGIKLVEEDGKTYFQYTLGAPATMFYARYYISSSLYMPVPADFIELVGAKNYLSFNSDKTATPVDNALALGAYALEAWDDQQIVFKKNANYVYADTKYSIEGVHINILPAALTDTEAAMKEFLAGKIDSCGIPDTYLDQYLSDPRTKSTTGTSCFKLNMNALDQETWIKLFGENGSYSQTDKKNYWETEPALSNAHFRMGLSYAFDRVKFATAKGTVATVNYFSSNYMSDPENGISYNATQQHKDAIKTLTEGTDGYGYDLELARDYFRMALDELESDGLIKPGTSESPTVIELEIAWFNQSMKESFHDYAAKYWETAFNDESVTGGRYKLQCKFWCGETADDCYDKILSGCYDIGFGSITGNPLDPLNFFSVNSTNPSISQDFTLNWAIDTGMVEEALVYGGKRWSFDALYQATQGGTLVSKGQLVVESAIEEPVVKKNDDGSFEITLTITNHEAVDSLVLEDLVIFGGDSSATYNEWSLDPSTYTSEYDAEANKLVIHVKVSAAEAAKVPVANNQGIDVYYQYVIGEASFSSYKSAYIAFNRAAE